MPRFDKDLGPDNRKLPRETLAVRARPFGPARPLEFVADRLRKKVRVRRTISDYVKRRDG